MFEWIVKFLIFNAAMVLAYLVIIFVFGMPLDEMEEFGRYAVPILLGMGNVVFFVYDIAFNKSHRRVPAPLAQIVSQAF